MCISVQRTAAAVVQARMCSTLLFDASSLQLEVKGSVVSSDLAVPCCCWTPQVCSGDETAGRVQAWINEHYEGDLHLEVRCCRHPCIQHDTSSGKPGHSCAGSQMSTTGQGSDNT